GLNSEVDPGRFAQSRVGQSSLPTQQTTFSNGQYPQQQYPQQQQYYPQQRYDVQGHYKPDGQGYGQHEAWQVKVEGDGMRYGGMGAYTTTPSVLPPLRGHPAAFQPQQQYPQQQHGAEKGMFMNALQASGSDPFFNNAALPPPPPTSNVMQQQHLSPYTYGRPGSNASSPSMQSYNQSYQQQPYYQPQHDASLQMDISSPLTEPDVATFPDYLPPSTFSTPNTTPMIRNRQIQQHTQPFDLSRSHSPSTPPTHPSSPSPNVFSAHASATSSPYTRSPHMTPLNPTQHPIHPYSPALFTQLLLPHTFPTKQLALAHLKRHALSFGFSVLVRTSKPDYVVVICNCGRRLKKLKSERKRNRKFKTALTGCEWRVVVFKNKEGRFEFRGTSKMVHNHPLGGVEAMGGEFVMVWGEGEDGGEMEEEGEEVGGKRKRGGKGKGGRGKKGREEVEVEDEDEEGFDDEGDM
ncbi:hypothetical protein HDV00_010452, partial [Rhizophlyctis rosea]